MPNENETQTENILDLAKFRDDILRNPKLSSTEKVILLDIILYAGTNGEAFPSQATLAKNHGLSIRQVYNVLVKLKDKNYILRWKQRGYSKSNRYILNRYLIYKQRNRKQTSTLTSSSIPPQSGSVFPPNISQEFNHVSTNETSYKVILEKIENYNGKTSIDKDKRVLQELVNTYGILTVENAFSLAIDRHPEYIKPLYLEKILQDEKNNPVVFKKEPFLPCGKNGCTNGYVIGSDNVARPCTCKIEYERNKNKYKEINQISVENALNKASLREISKDIGAFD